MGTQAASQLVTIRPPQRSKVGISTRVCEGSGPLPSYVHDGLFLSSLLAITCVLICKHVYPKRNKIISLKVSSLLLLINESDKILKIITSGERPSPHRC